ncbi:hypothetical protein ACFP3Q_03900 [Nocardioides sp. GCM10027113]|uniref:hypothetical protein n=1 Tax=unclassified Nocardioides TaxID=2615069 RepID=UPI00361D5034
MLLTPVVSGQLLGSLRRLFPAARSLFTELQDDGRGIRLSGPLSRIAAHGPDGYFVAHGLGSFAPIVQSEARLQLAGSRQRTPPRIGPSTQPLSSAPEPGSATGEGMVVWVRHGSVPTPAGRRLDLAPVDALVSSLDPVPAPRTSVLWAAVVAECAVHLARSTAEPVLVDVPGLEVSILAELQVRVASELVPHVTWPG